MKSGIHSARRVSPIAEAILEWASEHVVWIEDVDGPSVQAWAWTEAQAVLAREALDVAADDDAVEVAERRVTRAEGAAARRRAELGLGPVARTRLLRERAELEHSAFDLDELRRVGREALASRTIDVEQHDDDGADGAS
jgi:hypothetical protein